MNGSSLLKKKWGLIFRCESLRLGAADCRDYHSFGILESPSKEIARFQKITQKPFVMSKAFGCCLRVSCQPWVQNHDHSELAPSLPSLVGEKMESCHNLEQRTPEDIKLPNARTIHQRVWSWDAAYLRSTQPALSQVLCWTSIPSGPLGGFHDEARLTRWTDLVILKKADLIVFQTDLWKLRWSYCVSNWFVTEDMEIEMILLCFKPICNRRYGNWGDLTWSQTDL